MGFDGLIITILLPISNNKIVIYLKIPSEIG